MPKIQKFSEINLIAVVNRCYSFISFIYPRVLLVLTSENELQLHSIRYSDVVGELGVQVLQQVLNCTTTPINMIKDSPNTV